MATKHINFDELSTVSYTIGEREFTVRPQRRAMIERILEGAYKDEPEGSSGIKDWFKNWDRQFPLFALIFGYEDLKAEETKEVVKHLEQYMPLKAGPVVFEDWWNVNGIEDFFVRGGMPFFPVNLVPRLKDQAETVEENLEASST